MKTPRFIEATIGRADDDGCDCGCCEHLANATGDDCECVAGGDDGPYTIEANTGESIGGQIERALFLPGELVAIVRLDDLKALIEASEHLEELMDSLPEDFPARELKAVK